MLTWQKLGDVADSKLPQLAQLHLAILTHKVSMFIIFILNCYQIVFLNDNPLLLKHFLNIYILEKKMNNLFVFHYGFLGSAFPKENIVNFYQNIGSQKLLMAIASIATGYYNTVCCTVLCHLHSI